MMEMNKIIEIKSDILQYGVNFEPYNMFMDFKDMQQYKTKKINKKPEVIDGEVYDTSNDINVMPSEVLLKYKGKSSVVKLRYNKDSMISIRIHNEKLIVYKLGYEEKDIDIEMIKKYNILEKLISIEGTEEAFKVEECVDIVGIDRISILFYDGCYNWNCGRPCKFCDLHPKEKGEKSIRPNVNSIKNYENISKWWQSNKTIYFKSIKKSMQELLNNINLEHKHLLLMAGNLENTEEVWNIAEETIESMSKYIDFCDFDVYLNIAPHDNKERLERIKSLGIKQVQYNLEIANKNLFEYTCPGKIEYDIFVKKLKEAVTIMDRGNVRTNFVLGLQDIDELLQEIENLAKFGVVSDYSVFQPKPNTEYYNKKTPSFEEVKYFTERLVEIYIKYGFRPIYCTRSSRSSIINELYEEKNSRNF